MKKISLNTDLEDVYMQNEGIDYFLNKQDA